MKIKAIIAALFALFVVVGTFASCSGGSTTSSSSDSIM